MMFSSRFRIRPFRFGIAALALLLAEGCGERELSPPAVQYEAADASVESESGFVRLFSDTIPTHHVLLAGEHRWPVHGFYDTRRQHLDTSRTSVALGDLVQATELSPEATGLMVYGKWEHGSLGKRVDFGSPITQEMLDGYRLTFTTDTELEAEPQTPEVRVLEIVPTPWEFLSEPATVPADGLLDFSHALERWSPAPAHLRVYVVADGNRTLVWEHVQQPTEAAAGWQDVTLNLEQWNGRTVQILFRTDIAWAAGAEIPERAWTRPAWGSPILYSATSPARGEQEPPNIILISLDTLRADHLGTYGYELPTSPNIDSFAETAVVFEEAFAPSSWTLPSHAAMLSGQHPTQQPRTDEHFYRLPDEMELIAEVAARNGYLTAAYTDGVLVGGDIGFAQGFDRYYDGPGHVGAPQGTSTEIFGRALEWIETRGHLPFFLFVHTYEVHWPHEPLEPYRSQFVREAEAGEGAPDKRALELQLYDAEIAHTDHEVGRFMDALRAMGLFENTVVIVTSDHGEEFGERGHKWHMNTVHRESLHVPLIVHLPSKSSAPARVQTAVSITDLFSTMLDVMGVTDLRRYDSHSLMPLLLKGADSDAYSREILPFGLRHLQKRFVLAGAQRGAMKYFARGDLPGPDSELQDASGLKYADVELRLLDWLSRGDGPAEVSDGVEFSSVDEQLFDIQADPGERTDLSEVKAEQVEIERRRVLTYLRELDEARPRGLHEQESTPLGAEEQENLEALGYL